MYLLSETQHNFISTKSQSINTSQIKSKVADFIVL
jgi:hypothetical protein